MSKSGQNQQKIFDNRILILDFLTIYTLKEIEGPISYYLS